MIEHHHRLIIIQHPKLRINFVLGSLSLLMLLLLFLLFFLIFVCQMFNRLSWIGFLDSSIPFPLNKLYFSHVNFEKTFSFPLRFFFSSLFLIRIMHFVCFLSFNRDQLFTFSTKIYGRMCEQRTHWWHMLLRTNKNPIFVYFFRHTFSTQYPVPGTCRSFGCRNSTWLNHFIAKWIFISFYFILFHIIYWMNAERAVDDNNLWSWFLNF